MARVCLINPQVASCSWGSGRAPQNMDEALPRHSLTHLSAVLKHAGHEVSLLDLRLISGWEEYAQALRTGRPDVVCVTAHTIEAEIALECFSRAKSEYSDSLTIAGGIHFTMFPEAAMDTGCVDYVVRGEGEVTLPRLIANPSQFDRIIWGDPPDLDRLPFEDRGLYPDYQSRIDFPLWDLPRPTVDILTGRGCPWKCRFCCGPGEKNLYTKASGTINPGRRIPYIRRRSVDHVMNELEVLHNQYAFRSLVFHDDQFLLKEAWVMEFCERMHREGYVKRGVRWWAASRADMICRYPEVLKAMKNAGLKIISVGFESFKDEILAWIHKGVDSETNRKAAEICHSLGLDIYANVIFGIPRPNGKWYIADDMVSLKALETIRPRFFSPSFFNPVPGSWFFDWVIQNRLMDDRTLHNRGSRSLNQCWIKGVDYDHLAVLITDLGIKLSNPLKHRLLHYINRALDIGKFWTNRSGT